MGDNCIICPLCGFRECGQSTCPNCGIKVEDGRVIRLEPRSQVCSCGYFEHGTNVFCPVCGETLAEPVADKMQKCGIHAHHKWQGLVLVCECNDGPRMTTMEPDVAREIPYCPFCLEPLDGYRPDAINKPFE